MDALAKSHPTGRDWSRLKWSVQGLGFSLGGFFDGILLHQVLQWHHLLSGLQAGIFDDARVQIFADGVFHLAMYVVAVVSLWLLWRCRAALAQPVASRAVISGALVGFGVWHVLDAVLSHWITGIHRIRMDSQVPLLWDIAWLVLFGVVPLAVGWWVGRVRQDGTPNGGKRAVGLVVFLVATSGPIAALPPAGGGRDAVAVFWPGIAPEAAMEAVAAVGGQVVWTDRSGGVWALVFDDPTRAHELYARGALLVSGGLSPAGCLTWSRAS